VTHHANPDFWAAYYALPTDIQALADKNFALLKADARYPSLHFKPVGPYWSARVGRKYRALAVERSGDYVWFWIGTHSEYDRMIGHP
jgi:hypothetical protein